MKKYVSMAVALLICLAMMISFMPMSAFAALIDYEAHDDYYKVITKDDYELAPGIIESEIVLNNAAGTHRQVAHVVEVDLSNEYTKVMPSYAGMLEALESGTYKTQVMSQQAAWAEANGYGNVVAAMNISLSWYNSDYYVAHPELIGEPLGYLVMDGNYFENSQGKTSGAQTCLVINFDEKDGEARPADIPKVQIRSSGDAITGWEEQVIPANFGYLVKDGVNQYKKDNNAANGASRSFIGIKADGTFVMVMNDGRQSPYSAGFTSYEMAEFMLSLGCVAAINGDGGGSSTFLSQRPGEELKLNCSPSDGAERPTTHGILVISTAPATGEFVRATISAENDYYTPYSKVAFSAIGTDLVGTAADIPEDVVWQLKDSSFGSVDRNGVFTSNGKTGTATVQMVYNGEVVGEASVNIVVPTEFSFSQSVMTVPFDKEVVIGLKATINDGLHEVVLNADDVSFATTNSALGTFDGFKFTSVSEENAPADLTSTLTATLVHNTSLVATAELNLGKGSEVIFDFETGIDEWLVGEVNGSHYIHNITHANIANGQVHDGTGSLRLETNGLISEDVSSGSYAQADLYLKESVIIKNAKTIGFWAYIPDEYEHCWIRVLYWYDSDGNGTYDKKNIVSVINQPTIYDTADESGWYYFSVDISDYSSIMITGLDQTPTSSANTDANNYRFIEFIFPHTNTNDLWKEFGSINGPYTIYIDNITVDYSDAVDDREAPIFGNVSLIENETEAETVLEKYNTVKTKNNLINVTALVSENTAKTNATGLNADSAKAYIDGVEVECTYINGRIMINDIAVADGVHRVKFEICDNMGNKSVVIRLIEVESGVDASTVQVVPADTTLDRLYGGSIYWMNVNATDIETIESVSMLIDLNGTNHWELAHMELAEGFTATYSVNAETNTATITITRTGENTQTGEATLASLPIRILYYDTDINLDDYTAETYWNTFDFWPQDLKVDVDMGKITYVDGYTSDVLNVFSNEEFSVDTEMYATSGSMDAAYKAERGTCHVHSAEAIAKKDATCTTDGYTGRTYCYACESVVDWGTSISATGHTYKAADGKLVCDCGEQYIRTGLVEVSEKYYYMIAGSLANGWQQIGEDWYYFDAATYASVASYNNGYVTFEFELDGKLKSGQWYHSSKGSRYYYGPDYYAGNNYSDKRVTIDGKDYVFEKTGYCLKGYAFEKVAYSTVYQWYNFGTDGAIIEKWDYTGLTSYNGYLYYLENGVSGYGMFYIDGAYYYFASANYRAAVTNLERYCPVTNGLMPAGTYKFGADGKMIVDGEEPEGPEIPIDPNAKNGLIADEDGEVRYYVNDVATYAGLVKDSEGNYYYINSTLKAVKNCIYTIGIAKTNGLMPAGTYEFDADGKMVVDGEEPKDPEIPIDPNAKNGLVADEDGAIRYYVDGVATYAGLVKDSEGNYYYINSTLKAVKNCIYAIGTAKTNGLMPAGTYEFDADGKMIIESEEPEITVKNGLVADEDGAIRYYVNDVATYAGLVKDSEGNYYYINSTLKAVKNCIYTIGTAKTNGLMPAGTYEFDADGKMIIEPEEPESTVKNGLVADEDGAIRYYVDGVATYAGLVKDSEGNYYYINSTLKAVKNCIYTIGTAKTNGLMPAGTYEFDADGKIVNP